ncbi:3895_t:CDS:2, partial [Gigaspora margarita]
MEKLQDLSPQSENLSFLREDTQAAEGGETGSNLTVSTFTDWMELLEHEKVEENLYSSKSDASLLNSSEEENLQASLPESSSNFDRKRSDNPLSADLHMGVRLNSSEGNLNPYQKKKTWSNSKHMKKYAKERIVIFQQTLYGFISTRSNKEILTVKLRRVPIAARDKISEEIKEAFGNIVFGVTNDEDLVQRIPRYIDIMEQKKAARTLKQQYKEYKQIKTNHAMVSNPTSVTQQSQEDEQEALQETTGSDLNNLEMTVIDQDMKIVLQEQRIIDDARQTEELAIVQLKENKDEEVVDINVWPIRFENSLRKITLVEEIQPCSVDVSVLEGNSSQFLSKVNHKEDSFIQKVRNGGTMLTRLDYIFLDDKHMQLCKKVDTLFGNSDHALVCCTLRRAEDMPGPSLWKLNSRSFKNPKTIQEISQELKKNSDDTDWDFSKIKIQSIVQAFKPLSVSEKRIKKINKKINELKRSLVRDPNL